MLEDTLDLLHGLRGALDQLEQHLDREPVVVEQPLLHVDLRSDRAQLGRVPSHWRECCHFADGLSPSLLRQRLQIEGGAAE